jgi:hypothetical protein
MKSALNLGRALALSGHRQEALQILADAEARSRRTSVSPMWMAELHAALGEKDRAFVLLERALEEHAEGMPHLNVWPTFNRLRSDPLFARLVKRMGLTP